MPQAQKSSRQAAIAEGKPAIIKQIPELEGRLYDTLEFKAQVIKFTEYHATKMTKTEIARRFQIKRPTLYAWMKQKDAILHAKDKLQRRKLPGNGRKAMTLGTEQQIVAFIIKAQQKTTNVLTKKQILEHCDALIPHFAAKSRQAKYRWLSHFLERHALRIDAFVSVMTPS